MSEFIMRPKVDFAFKEMILTKKPESVSSRPFLESGRKKSGKRVF